MNILSYSQGQTIAPVSVLASRPPARHIGG